MEPQAIAPPSHSQSEPNSHKDIDDDDDTDAILAELESEEATIQNLQQTRLEELQSQKTTSKSNSTTITHLPPTYKTLTSDDQTLHFTTTHAKSILHFFHPTFPRCTTMDTHLTLIAQTHESHDRTESDVAFARVDVRHAEFVVQKLGVRVLPCVIGFVDGVVKGRVVGFEGVCWDERREGDARVARALEGALVGWGCLRGRVLGMGDGDDDGDEEDEEGEGERGGRRRVGGGFRKARGIHGRKQMVTDEDDDWD